MNLPAAAGLTLLLAFTAAAQSSRPESRIRGKFRDADVREVIQAIVKGRQQDLVVHDLVRGKVSIELDHADMHAALAAAVASLDAEVRADEHGVISIMAKELTADVAQPEATELGDLDFRAAALRIAELTKLNVIVGPGVEGRMRAKVDAATGRDALRAAMPAGAVLVESNGIVRVVRRPAAATDGWSCSFVDAPIAEVVKKLSRDAEHRVELTPEVQGALTMHLRDVPWRHALTLAAEAVGARVVVKEKEPYRITCTGVNLPANVGANAALGLALGGSKLLMTTDVEGLTFADFVRLAGALLRAPVALADDLRPPPQTFVARAGGSARKLVEAIVETYGLQLIELDDGGFRIAPRR